MEKNIITVPKGIRYISQWEDFRLPDYPHIMDKQIPGCGFTEWCLTNNQDLILCSPRNMLILNKYEQHLGEVYRVTSDKYDTELEIDKDLSDERNKAKSNSKAGEKAMSQASLSSTKEADPDKKLEEWREKMAKFLEQSRSEDETFVSELQREVGRYIRDRRLQGKPYKFLVTYDSFRLLKEALKRLGEFNEQTQVVIDEFQSIFVDSRFKSQTEVEFINTLQGIQRICYMSATPMMGEYLAMIPEFSGLPYFELDWVKEDPGRIQKPKLKIRIVESIFEPAKKIVNDYREGRFETTCVRDKETGQLKTIESREAMIYVNSVANIISIIDKTGLEPEEVNILCANTNGNASKIQKKLGKRYKIGKVPLKNEPRKMFTLCTRTVYLGADFYSDNARTFILSDANIECLAVDISLDLPQIMGRQRLEENPWKNSAEFYYKNLKKNGKVTKEEFDAILEEKIKVTESILRGWNDVKMNYDRHNYAVVLLGHTVAYNYESDYVVVNKHAGNDLLPSLNNLVMIAERRAFDIQQIDYADRFSVFNRIEQATGYKIDPRINEFLEKYNSSKRTRERLQLFCESELEDDIKEEILNTILDDVVKKYLILGKKVLKAHNYNTSLLKAEMMYIDQSFKNTLIKSIYNEFQVGEIIPKQEVKSRLNSLYQSLNYNKRAKATDLAEWFSVREREVNKNGLRKICIEILDQTYTTID